MTERKIVEKWEKLSLSLISPGFSDTCTNWAPTDSNDNYNKKVSENNSFIFVDFVDLKIFKFKSRELFWDTLYTMGGSVYLWTVCYILTAFSRCTI